MRNTKAAIAAIALFTCASAGWALQERVFAPGELVETRSGTFKILECRMNTVGKYRECRALLWKNGGPASNPAWFDAGSIASDEIARAPKPAARAAVPAAGRPAAAAAAAAAATLTGPCPRTPYGGPVAGTTPASKALFQRKVADNYTMGAYGPFWYGVTFERFTVGAPIRNAVGQAPGGGATRVNNGAPAGATMYPVSSQHIVCEGAPTSAERRRVVSNYLCFVSKNNEWTCGGDGVPRTTRLP